MKWAMVLVGILVLSMCGGKETVDTPAIGEGVATTTSSSTSTSTTTTMAFGGGGLPTTTTTTTTTPTPDLSGVWDAGLTQWIVSGNEHCKVNTFQQGTVLIVQQGSTFMLTFQDGFACDPPEACDFLGTVDGGCYVADNGGVEVESGGTYMSAFEMCVDAADSQEVDTVLATGASSFEHPDFECGWEMELEMSRSDG